MSFSSAWGITVRKNRAVRIVWVERADIHRRTEQPESQKRENWVTTLYLIMSRSSLRYPTQVTVRKEIEIVGKIKLTTFRTSSVTCGAHCKMKMQIPLFRLMKDFKVAIAGHETKSWDLLYRLHIHESCPAYSRRKFQIFPPQINNPYSQNGYHETLHAC